MTREERFRQLLELHGDVSDGIKARSVRSGAIAMASEAIDFVLRVGSIAILARLLVPEHFGLLAMVTAITTIAERFKDLGLSAATVQRPEINHAQISTLFWINAGVGIGLAVLVAACAYPIAQFYDDQRLLAITMAVAISFIWSGASIQHQALLRRSMRFGQMAIIQIGSSALSIVIAVVAAKMGMDYWALVVREVSRNVFVAVGSWIFFPWMPSAPTRQAGVGSMLRFGGNLTGFYILHYMSTSIGQVLIGKLFGAHSLGFYRQGQALVLAPIQQLSGPVTAVADAALCRLQGNAEKYRRYYAHLLMLMSMATVPLVAVLAIFADEFVLILLGPKWREAAPIFRLLAIAVILNPSLMTTGTVTTTCGYSRRFFWLGVAEAISLIAFFVIGIPWGPTGIASAHVWTFYVLAVPWMYWCLKSTPVDVRLFLVTIAKPVAATAIMSALLVLLKRAELTSSALLTLVVGCPLAVVIYFLAFGALPGGRDTLRGIWVDVNEALNLERFVPFRSSRRSSSTPTNVSREAEL